MVKYAPKKVFILENGLYKEITYSGQVLYGQVLSSFTRNAYGGDGRNV